MFIYTTESSKPLALVTRIHYDSLTDASWNEDKNLVISSKDGFCSIISFPPGYFGERLMSADIEDEKIKQIAQTYEEAIMD